MKSSGIIPTEAASGMTPLNRSEQLLLAGLLALFVSGAGLVAWQQKSLDRELAGLTPPMPVQTAHRVAGSAKSEAVVSLSSAGQEELEQLPGIGPRLAEEIIRYRRERPFQSPEDLTNVPGIGRKKLERIRSRIKP